jgi:hypothetical protein
MMELDLTEKFYGVISNAHYGIDIWLMGGPHDGSKRRYLREIQRGGQVGRFWFYCGL